MSSGPAGLAGGQEGRSPDILSDALLAASPDAVVVVGPTGRVHWASPSVETLFGYPPEELLGQEIEVLVPGELRSVHVAHRSLFMEDPRPRPMGLGLSLSGRRRDGSTFPVDVSLAPIGFGNGGWVGAFVRDASERRRSEALLREVNEISRELLGGRPTPEILALTARYVLGLAGGTTSWVVVPAGPGLLRVAAAQGRGAEELLGTSLSADTSHSARAMREARPVVVPDLTADPDVLAQARQLGLGPGAYLPLVSEQGAVGVLVVARSAGAPSFGESDLAAGQVFAASAGVVLALGRARSELEAMELVTEHERIARDLHDTVIQRLFAVGMGLQGVQRLAQGAVAERIDSSVQALDGIIRDIRETIFDLNRRPAVQPDLRLRAREVAAEAAVQLGFAPAMSFRGPIEAAVDEETALHLLSVLREALSNAARHAEATAVEVTISADQSYASLTVVDNGRGLGEDRVAGNGLANIAERARQLGGQLQLSTEGAAGTTVSWRVPLRSAGAG